MEKKDTRLPEMVDCEFGKYRLDNRKGYRGTAKQCTEQGIHLVFANLPDVSVIRKNQKFMELVGIKKITADSGNGEREWICMTNLMLGGENIY
ncbi:MAG: hypothetical protein ACLVB0_01470 [Fusicatenibacter saccharivorans]